MKTLLQINTSLFSESGNSSRLAQQFVDNWKLKNPDGQVVVRDLAKSPIPHLDAERFAALIAKDDARDAAQRAVVDFSDVLIDEIRNADLVVLGLPMYNFGVPSQLKAYFDHLARAGVSFHYTPNGPEGLLPNVPVYVFATRGGLYRDTPRDTETSYVRDFLAFIGLRTVQFVYAEGLHIGPEQKDAALKQAYAEIEQIAA